MLIYRRSSLLESPAQTLVNTVNCVGVMGKGLASEFKAREPTMFERYRTICNQKELQPGRLWLWRGTSSWILNFPTKLHWKQPSRLEWIEQGLAKFLETYEDLKIREISFPRLGCGNGNLSWLEVRPIMESMLRKTSIPVYIHDYQKDIGIPEHLEELANIASSQISKKIDFDSFVNGIRLISVIGGEKLVELNSGRKFKARVDENKTLYVEDERFSWEFGVEDLHSAWISLLKGLVTKERIEWATGDGGDLVITLISLLPSARAVEIQKGHNPEIAAELLPWAQNVNFTQPAHEQLKLQWH